MILYRRIRYRYICKMCVWHMCTFALENLTVEGLTKYEFFCHVFLPLKVVEESVRYIGVLINTYQCIVPYCNDTVFTHYVVQY